MVKIERIQADLNVQLQVDEDIKMNAKNEQSRLSIWTLDDYDFEKKCIKADYGNLPVRFKDDTD